MSGIAGIKAGKAFILIEAVDVTGKVLNQVRNRLGKFGAELSNIGRTMAMRAIGALTPVGLAVKAGTAYDDIMRKVEARSEGTSAEMAILREQTLKLGRAFGILPSALGAGQNIFAQAGFSRKEIASIVPEVAQLARATGDSTDEIQNMEQAGNAVTAVLRAFHLNADDAAMVAGKIGITATASSFGLEGITTSLSHAASAASTYGISLDEMLSVMAAMKDIQLDDSIVGTAFRNMMGYMSQTDEQEKFNKKLFEATGNTIEFTDALRNMHGPAKLLPALLKATESMGSSDRMNLLFGLLETRAVIPAIAAGSSVGRMAEMSLKLQKWEGANAKMQKHMDAGSGGSMRRFMATLEKIAIATEQILAPAFKTATAAAETLFTMFETWGKANPGTVAGIVAMSVGMLALGTAMIVAGQAVISLSALFGLGAILASTTAFLLAFVAPWAAAAIGIYLAADAIDKFTGTTNLVNDSVNDLNHGINDTKGMFTALAVSGKETSQHLYDDWSKTFKSIGDSLKSGDIAGAFETLSLQAQVTWTEMINFLMDKWGEFQQFLSDTVSQSGSGGFMMEMGAQMAALAAYHTAPKDKRAEYGARAYQDYKDHFQGTLAGQLAESQNSPEAQARKASKEKRDADLKGLRDEQRLREVKKRDEAAAAVKAGIPRNSTFDPVKAAADAALTARIAKMEAEAAALIGRKGINKTIAPGANTAVDYNSAEGVKSFMENNFAMYGDKALAEAEKAGELLASIDRKIDGLAMGLA